MNDTKYFKINKKKQTVYEIRSNTLYNGYLHNHDFRKCPLPCRYRRTVSIRSYRLGNFWNLAKFDWNSAWYLRYARHTESIRDLIRGTVTGRTCRVASDNPLDIPRENGSWRSGTIVYIYIRRLRLTENEEKQKLRDRWAFPSWTRKSFEIWKRAGEKFDYSRGRHAKGPEAEMRARLLIDRAERKSPRDWLLLPR